jgi:hypothetical protein
VRAIKSRLYASRVHKARAASLMHVLDRKKSRLRQSRALCAGMNGQRDERAKWRG